MLKASNLIVLALIIIVSVVSVDGKDKKGKGRIKSHSLTPEITQEIIYRSNHYGLDPLLILEVMRQESSFNPLACSSANARGLMQFIPSTARRFGISDAHNVAQSIDAGCRYLAFLIRKFDGRLDLVLAGYNAGEGAVEKFGNKVPPYNETQNYVRTIISNYKRALAVKQAFLAQNNAVVAQANQSNLVKPTINSNYVSRYKRKAVVTKKPLTKRKLQQKLAELDSFSSRKMN